MPVIYSVTLTGYSRESMAPRRGTISRTNTLVFDTERAANEFVRNNGNLYSTISEVTAHVITTEAFNALVADNARFTPTRATSNDW